MSDVWSLAVSRLNLIESKRIKCCKVVFLQLLQFNSELFDYMS